MAVFTTCPTSKRTQIFPGRSLSQPLRQGETNKTERNWQRRLKNFLQIFQVFHSISLIFNLVEENVPSGCVFYHWTEKKNKLLTLDRVSRSGFAYEISFFLFLFFSVSF
jgi:hypothetical protein